MKLIIIILLTPLFLVGQSIGVGTVTPDASAKLEISSTNSGVLIPRLTTVQRGNISSPATGLIIYNLSINKFEYFNGISWEPIDGGPIDKIRDLDGDTFVQTKENNSNDYIQFYVEGSHVFSMLKNPNGVPRIVPVDNTSNSTIIGFLAGNSLNNQSISNTFIGNEAGKNQTGNYNVIVGDKAGQTISSGSENVQVGVQAGQNNNGSNNTLIGRDAGKESSSTLNSTYIGHSAGVNATGNSNTFVGKNAGKNAVGNGNIGIGVGALSSQLIGTQNVVIGNAAGGNLKNGSNNVLIGNEAGGDEGGENNIFVGSQSGFNNAGNNNSYLGHQSGQNSTGSNNVFIGKEAGRNEDGSDKLFIENTNSDTPLIFGDFLEDLVRVNGDLEVNGNLNIATIDVNQITGVIGTGFSIVLPDVIYNNGNVEINGVGMFDDILISSSLGIEVDTFCTPNGSNCLPELGMNMEFPLILETSDPTVISALQNWFDSPNARDISVITENLQGNEIFRYNLYDFIPDIVEPGSDGRTKFSIISNLPPDNNYSINQEVDFGSQLSCTTGDVLLEISGIINNFSPDSINIDYQSKTIMIEFGYNEGAGLFDWLKDCVEVAIIRREMFVIETSNCQISGETSRTSFYEVLPFRYEVIYGFGLNTKFKGRLYMKYALAE